MDKKLEIPIVNSTTENQNDPGSFLLDVKDACKNGIACVRNTGEKFVNRTIVVTKDTIKKIPVYSIGDIISKAKCVIPKNADNILRASLLQQCISPSLGK